MQHQAGTASELSILFVSNRKGKYKEGTNVEQFKYGVKEQNGGFYGSFDMSLKSLSMMLT